MSLPNMPNNILMSLVRLSVNGNSPEKSKSTSPMDTTEDINSLPNLKNVPTSVSDSFTLEFLLENKKVNSNTKLNSSKKNTRTTKSSMTSVLDLTLNEKNF